MIVVEKNETDLGAEFDRYLRRLFPLCRSLTGEGNRETLRIMQEIAPLTIREIPSGKRVYDWSVPDEWNIRDAFIAEVGGGRLVDFRASNLHVVGYSEPVDLTIGWEELRPHLHVHASLPAAIPYRTRYYRREWGFCVTQAQYAELERKKGPFRVIIDADLRSGAMTYGECLLAGRSPQEILISCYICHPSLANDSLSGVLLSAFLARHLSKQNDRQWSYRFVFVPETIGAIAYCAANEAALKRVDLGLVITTVGGPGKFGYKQSWNAEHGINRLIEEVLVEGAHEFIRYPFDVHGSDERQYSSLGFRINCATISKDRYYEYPEYHSSQDNLEFVTGDQIARTFALYCRLLEKIEARCIYRSRQPNGEVMLSRHGLYPTNGGEQRPDQGGRSELDLILWLLFLCDGRASLDDVAAKLKVPVAALEGPVAHLVRAGLIEAV
jgi:aminopeptidase-like protein